LKRQHFRSLQSSAWGEHKTMSPCCKATFARQNANIRKLTMPRYFADRAAQPVQLHTQQRAVIVKFKMLHCNHTLALQYGDGI